MFDWVLNTPLAYLFRSKLTKKMNFSIKDFFSKCHLLKRSLMENFIFCVVVNTWNSSNPGIIRIIIFLGRLQDKWLQGNSKFYDICHIPCPSRNIVNNMWLVNLRVFCLRLSSHWCCLVNFAQLFRTLFL